MMQSKIHPSLNLQYPGVSRSAVTFSGPVVTGGSVMALALKLAALAIGAGITEFLAAPASVPVCTHTGPRDGVAQGLILTLAAVAAVGSPVVTVTTWKTHSHLPG